MNSETLSDRLGSIKEPDLLLPLSQLGMISQVQKRMTRFAVELFVYQGDRAYFEALAQSLVDAAAEDGAKLDVTITPMNEEQLDTLEEVLAAANSASASASGERVNKIMAPGTKTRVLGFSSGKGGVGKSSVTVGVAAALAARGHKVGILDADVYGFSVPKMLGLQRPPAVIGKLLVPPVAFGIKTISMGFFVSDDTPVIWRGPMLHKALEQFVVDVFWGDLDFLCVDLPPGTGDVTLSLAEFLPKVETFVVTTPQSAAERVAQRSALAARKLKLPLRGVIENMSYFRGDDGKRYDIFGQGGGEKLAESLEVPLIGQVPIDIPLREGGDVGTPVVISAPDSEVAKSLISIAESIEGMGPARIYKAELKVR